MTLREFLEALGKIPQLTDAAALPRVVAALRRRLRATSTPAEGVDASDVIDDDDDDVDASLDAAATAYALHWAPLAVHEFLTEATQAYERTRRRPQHDGSAVLGLRIVDVAADQSHRGNGVGAAHRAVRVMREALKAAGVTNKHHGGHLHHNHHHQHHHHRAGCVIALVDGRTGGSPFDVSRTGGGANEGGVTKGDDALLSLDEARHGGSSSPPLAVEVEIVSVAPRLLVRVADATSFGDVETIRSAAKRGATAAWRLDRLAFRSVLTRRLNAVAALAEASPPWDGVDAGDGAMAGFSPALQRLISDGTEAMSGRRWKGARIDPGVRAVVLAGWGKVPAGECVAAAALPPSGVVPFATPLAALEALEEEEARKNVAEGETSAECFAARGPGEGDTGEGVVASSPLAGSLRTLNGSQRAAVASGLASRFTLVQGPPGTGKTHTAVVLVKMWLAHGLGPVLCCSESNIAVDNLLDGLIGAGVDAVRVGRPEAIRGDLLRHVAHHEGQLRRATAVCCTCAAAGGEMLEATRFGAALLDEASQQTELASLVALTKGARAVALVGDHRQLPPTVMSRDAERAGMSRSLFDRLQAQGLPPVLLDVQFRMHPALAAFPAERFYGGELRSGTPAARRSPPAGFPWPALPPPAPPESGGVDGAINTNATRAVRRSPVAFVSVDDGEEESVGESWANAAEVGVVMTVVAGLLAGGELRARDVGIITPYAAQVHRLRAAAAALALPAPARRELEISSVDGFQGREKEAVVFSAVRASAGGASGVGFLSDPRRVNVMLTRARRGLVVVGSRETLSKETRVWRRWIDWAIDRGLVVRPGGSGFETPPRNAPNVPSKEAASLGALDADDLAAEDAARSARRVLAGLSARTAAARLEAEARAGKRRRRAEEREREQRERERARKRADRPNGEENAEDAAKERKTRGSRGGKKVNNAQKPPPPPPPPPPDSRDAPVPVAECLYRSHEPAYLREAIRAALEAARRYRDPRGDPSTASAAAAAAAAVAACGATTEVSNAVAERADHHARREGKSVPNAVHAAAMSVEGATTLLSDVAVAAAGAAGMVAAASTNPNDDDSGAANALHIPALVAAAAAATVANGGSMEHAAAVALGTSSVVVAGGHEGRFDASALVPAAAALMLGGSVEDALAAAAAAAAAAGGGGGDVPPARDARAHDVERDRERDSRRRDRERRERRDDGRGSERSRNRSRDRSRDRSRERSRDRSRDRRSERDDRGSRFASRRW